MTRQKKRIIAACLFSTAGAIVYLISPVLLGAAMQSLNLNSGQAGAMLSVYFAGYTAISISAAYWLSKTNSRHVAAYSLLGFIAGLLGAALADSYATLIAAMALSGAGAGMLFGLSMATIAESDDPDRYYGVALASQLAFGSILLFLGPSIIGPKWGLSGLFFGTAVFVGVMGLSLPWMPEHLASGKIIGGVDERHPPAMPVIAGLGALLIWFTGFSGLYAFVERIGADSGLDGLTIGTVLSLTVITGMSGALGAAIIADRFGRVRPHLVGAIGTVLAMYLLSGQPDIVRYSIAIGFLTFSWNFWLAYLLGTIASADFTGRYSVLTTAALGLGATLGPGIAGSLVAGANFGPLFVFSNAMIIGGLLIILWVLSRLEVFNAAIADSTTVSAESK
jgi:predicted MFS family arabinose efflux permease